MIVTVYTLLIDLMCINTHYTSEQYNALSHITKLYGYDRNDNGIMLKKKIY